MKTKKTLKGIFFGVACCSMAVMFAACTPSETTKKHDPEERPVTLAIGALDRNFNPFFYTALNDGEVTGLTQLSMITVDSKAEPICGQNEATVALAYNQTIRDKDGNIKQDGDETSTTTYEFVIKNGIKFSDGVDLTIKDVLFNLYVYLDPYYAGSSTIYATKIKGLSAYRSQDPSAEDGDDNFGDQFQGDANRRFNALVEWDKRNFNGSVTPEMREDAATVARLFEQELESTWTSIKGTTDSYKENYNFTEEWEVFYFSTGFVGYQTELDTTTNSSVRKTDENGKYVMEFDEGGAQVGLRRNMNKVLEGLTGTEREEAMKKEAISTVFEEYLEVKREDEKDPDKITWAEAATTGKLASILYEWSAGSNARQQFLNESMSNYYTEMRKKGELPVKQVSGITTKKIKGSEFTQMKNGSPLNPNEEYDVLQIVIQGVDPVAIYNFGFAVAPMHYYSGTTGGVDYVKRAMETDPNDDKVADRFGVKYADKDFFDNVLKTDGINKSRKPVGAGAYKYSGEELLIGNDCLYVRNEYFHTVGEGIENAKIKYLTYRYIQDSQLVTTLRAGSVDFGMPNCTPQNIKLLGDGGNLHYNSYSAGGFGYVGINPKFVPDKEVRQAIMKAMDIAEITKTYYTERYSQVIYRPISTTSWVYLENDQKDYFTTYPGLELTTSHKEIENLVESAGWRKVNGIYQKDGQPLKLTFTIAGDTQDHPAFQMFKNAERFLNECGFDVTTLTDLTALTKLATGNLAVWAAAWTAGVDPDMYQVYHKDSKATSVKNWGYDVIYADTTEKFREEREIIDLLAEKIEEGRSYIDRPSRIPVYRDALDLVMQLAVELPTYQRNDMYVCNKDFINPASLNQNPNANAGVLNKIWELDYV